MRKKTKADIFLEELSETEQKGLLPIDDEGLQETFLKHAFQLDKATGALVSEIIFDYLFRKGETKDFDKYYIRLKDYDRQADSLIDLLVLFERDLIKEAARVNNLPIWQQLLSYVRHALNNGQQYFMLTSPEWQNNLSASNVAICKTCGKEFSAKRIGQVFCSNECGSGYSLRPKSGASMD
jgi:hypothetical protein